MNANLIVASIKVWWANMLMAKIIKTFKDFMIHIMAIIECLRKFIKEQMCDNYASFKFINVKLLYS